MGARLHRPHVYGHLDDVDLVGRDLRFQETGVLRLHDELVLAWIDFDREVGLAHDQTDEMPVGVQLNLDSVPHGLGPREVDQGLPGRGTLRIVHRFVIVDGELVGCRGWKSQGRGEQGDEKSAHEPLLVKTAFLACSGSLQGRIRSGIVAHNARQVARGPCSEAGPWTATSGGTLPASVMD